MSRKSLDEARVSEMYAQKATLKEVASELGVSVMTVQRTLARLGIKRRQGAAGRRTILDSERVRELYEVQQMSLRQTGAALGVSYIAVRNVCVRLGILRRSNNETVRLGLERGRSHAKLNPEKVVQLREMHARGVSEKECGKHFGISRTAARLAADGETWGHIPMKVG